MNERMRNFLVGLFVVASLTVLGVLMVWFGETPSWLPSSEWDLRITGVSELSGIGEGSTINLNGVEIGRVDHLMFKNSERPDQGVVIVARIQRKFSIPRGAFARVYGSTLGFGMGHIDIVVEPGVRAEPLPKKAAEIGGEMRSIIGELINKDLVQSVERMITHIADLAASAEPVAKNLALLIEQRTVVDTSQPGARENGLTPNLSTVIERIDILIAHVNAVLGDENLQDDVKVAVGDLKDASTELRETIALWHSESRRISDNVNAGIDRTEENLERSFVRLNEVLGNLDDAATSMATMMHEVAAGRGTAGLLVGDERLYEAAVLTFDRLSELIATIQRITGKIEEDGYITVGEATPVGTFTKNFPIAAQATDAAQGP